MPDFARFCQILPDMQRRPIWQYLSISREMAESGEIWHQIKNYFAGSNTRYALIWQDMARYGKIWQDLVGYLTIWQNLAEKWEILIFVQ